MLSATGPRCMKCASLPGTAIFGPRSCTSSARAKMPSSRRGRFRFACVAGKALETTSTPAYFFAGGRARLCFDVKHYLHVTEKRDRKRRKILLDAARVMRAYLERAGIGEDR